MHQTTKHFNPKQLDHVNLEITSTPYLNYSYTFSNTTKKLKTKQEKNEAPNFYGGPEAQFKNNHPSQRDMLKFIAGSSNYFLLKRLSCRTKKYKK